MKGDGHCMVPWSAQARKERQEQNIGNDFNQSIESGKIHADCGKKRSRKALPRSQGKGAQGEGEEEQNHFERILPVVHHCGLSLFDVDLPALLCPHIAI